MVLSQTLVRFEMRSECTQHTQMIVTEGIADASHKKHNVDERLDGALALGHVLFSGSLSKQDMCSVPVSKYRTVKRSLNIREGNVLLREDGHIGKLGLAKSLEQVRHLSRNVGLL